jgi:hypothetical protein
VPVNTGDRGVLALAREQQAEGAAHGDAAADDADLGAGDRDVVAAEQLDDAARRARQRRGDVEDQSTEVGRVQAVGVLVGVDQLERAALVEALRERQLHDVAGAGRVGVEALDGLVDLGLAGVGGQVLAVRGDADLGAVAVLSGDVGLAARVAPRERSGRPPMLVPRAATRTAAALDRSRCRLAVEDRAVTPILSRHSRARPVGTTPSTTV